MKVLASALVDTVDQFLHAGYISAYPRSLEAELFMDGGVAVELDMVAALQLQGEAAAAALGDGGVTMAAAAATGSPGMLAAAGAAAVGAAGFAFIQRQLGMTPRAAALMGAAAGLMVVGNLSCDPGRAEKALTPPWEGVELQSFADPESATTAIMVGIIAPGLANVDFDVEALENIQLEVGLPTTSPTEGMSHALETYGFDGWRNAFRLERTAGADVDENYLPVYTLTSAGEDGAFDNEDDMSMTVRGSLDSTWDVNRYATWLRKDDQGELVVVFHRWRGEHFEYANQAAAEALTGSELFDLFSHEQLDNWMDGLTSTYDDYAAEAEHDPIVLRGHLGL